VADVWSSGIGCGLWLSCMRLVFDWFAVWCMCFFIAIVSDVVRPIGLQHACPMDTCRMVLLVRVLQCHRCFALTLRVKDSSLLMELFDH
jgi:hypothetical protein